MLIHPRATRRCAGASAISACAARWPYRPAHDGRWRWRPSGTLTVPVAVVLGAILADEVQRAGAARAGFVLDVDDHLVARQVQPKAG